MRPRGHRYCSSVEVQRSAGFSTTISPPPVSIQVSPPPGGEPDGAAPVSTAIADRAHLTELPLVLATSRLRRVGFNCAAAGHCLHIAVQPGDSEAATTGFNNGLAQQAER